MTMLEVGRLPITLDSFVVQSCQQVPESGGQPSHYGVLHGAGFKGFENKVETELRVLQDAEFTNVRRHVCKAGVQRFDTALPRPPIVRTQFGVL